MKRETNHMHGAWARTASVVERPAALLDSLDCQSTTSSTVSFNQGKCHFYLAKLCVNVYDVVIQYTAP